MHDIVSFETEELHWRQNISVAGLDEAGMGALAGPVVAAAVFFAAAPELSEAPPIRDSKKLSERQRNVAAKWIKEHASTWAVGEATVQEIDSLNIRAASHLAMQRAVDGMDMLPDLVLVDGTPAQPHPTIPAESIVDGDAFVFSIAAASILAKVHRDSLLVKLGEQHPEYGFASHKGYGSASHLQALQEHGPSPAHRTSYAPVAKLLQ